MKKLIDYLYRFDHRLTYAIYGIENDFGFGCMDKTAIAEDLGFELVQAGVVIGVRPHPFSSESEVNNFPWKSAENGSNIKGELAGMFEWSKEASVPVGGGCFGPLTVTALILGVEYCMRLIRKKPEVVHAVLRHVTDYMVYLAREESHYDIDSFWIAEPVASLLSEKNCRIFCIPYLKEIFHAASVPGILHVCGKTDAHTAAFLEADIQGLSIDTCTNLHDCLALVPEDVVVMGNIDPIALLQEDKAKIAVLTEELLYQTRYYKNFIPATGCQVPDAAPFENVAEMIRVAKAYPCLSNEEYRLIRTLSRIYEAEGPGAYDSYLKTHTLSKVVQEGAASLIADKKRVLKQ